MSMKSKLGLYTLMAMSAGAYPTNPFDEPKRSKPKNKKAPNPKGTKEYTFDKDGNLTDNSDEVVFKCVAINEKNAIKKFNRWKSNQ